MLPDRSKYTAPGYIDEGLISFQEMNRLAEQVISKKGNVSLAQMRKQVAELKKDSRSKVKKQRPI